MLTPEWIKEKDKCIRLQMTRIKETMSSLFDTNYVLVLSALHNEGYYQPKNPSHKPVKNQTPHFKRKDKT